MMRLAADHHSTGKSSSLTRGQEARITTNYYSTSGRHRAPEAGDTIAPEMAADRRYRQTSGGLSLIVNHAESPRKPRYAPG
jgi:hypothetical protein